MPEIIKAQQYENLTAAVELIRQHNAKHFLAPKWVNGCWKPTLDEAPWRFLKHVEDHLLRQRDKIAAEIISEQRSKPEGFWGYWTRRIRNG